MSKFLPRLCFSSGLFTAVVASASFAQTDPSPIAGMSDAEARAYTEAFDKAFRTAFRVKSVNQCVASAARATAAGLDMTPTCACLAETLLETKSVKELQAMNTADPNNQELNAAVASCLKSDPPWPVSEQQQPHIGANK